jgi:excinuclease ABC subunit C
MAFDSSAFLETVPNSSGVYRMFNSENAIIYIGKAKNLKKRLSSYFQKDHISIKTQKLVANIDHIEFTVTFSETEALILENNLIKEFQPKYNILLKDDKSYPYILITKDEHPRIMMYRGTKKSDGKYFGPYPSSSAVKQSLHLLQKIFKLRPCSNNVYKNRSRPCLQYQLNRCLAPCVKRICDKAFYEEQVRLCSLFLSGKNEEVLKTLIDKMEQLSEELKFEEAAKIRDQFLALKVVQEQQSVSGDVADNIDVIGVDISDGLACVHVLFVRDGNVIGTRSYYPKLPTDNSKEELIYTFLQQFYLNTNTQRTLPNEIIYEFNDKNEEETFLNAMMQVFNKNIRLSNSVRGERAKYLKLAIANAKASLKSKSSHNNTLRERIEAFEEIFGFSDIERMECFDISHTMGEQTVASRVVFDRNGPNNKEYRRYNITGITAGDDYAAMNQVLRRRFGNITKDVLPQILFVDGGLGQLHEAEKIVTEIFSQHKDIEPPVIIGVAKGEGRKAGLETLIIGYTHEEYDLSLDNPALQLVLHIRDESHRFAITGHRHKREKARTVSRLQDIPGIGAKKRQALLKRLGGMQEIYKANIDELSKVPGISKKLAQDIYDFLHS